MVDIADPGKGKKKQPKERPTDYFTNDEVKNLQGLISEDSISHLRGVVKDNLQNRYGFKIQEPFIDRRDQILVYQTATINLLEGPDSRAIRIAAAARSVGDRIVKFREKVKPRVKCELIQFNVLVWDKTDIATDIKLIVVAQILV